MLLPTTLGPTSPSLGGDPELRAYPFPLQSRLTPASDPLLILPNLLNLCHDPSAGHSAASPWGGGRMGGGAAMRSGVEGEHFQMKGTLEAITGRGTEAQKEVK